MGFGTRIQFWLDLWCGDHPLRTAFRLLLCIARNKDAMVADYLCWQNGAHPWDVLFTRLLHEWE